MHRVLGIILISLGVCLNEWTIKFISNYETRFDSIEKSLFLIFIQILIISIGIYILIKKQRAFKNLSLLFLTLFILVVFFEIILSISYFQNLSSSSPIWIPQKYKNISVELNKRHQQKALRNKYLFNDINHSHKKDISTDIRIAVLGDSFIWGAGVPDSVIWTRKLERLFIKNGIKCEILNWGKSGWSTLDEYNFLKSEGFKYKFDYLIFAFVVNDPIMDSSMHKLFIYPNGFIERNILKPLSLVFPNTVSFFTDIVNNFLSTYSDYGYFNWLKNKVYVQNNLNKYSDLLKDIKKYCEDRNIAFVFVLTPENHNPLLKKYFDQIVNIFDQDDIPHYNLFPAVENSLKKYTIRELWANPADGHPGNLVTEVYSKNVYEYLINKVNIMPNQQINRTP